MNIICKNRGMGKTHDLIKLSAETGYQIVTWCEVNKRAIIEQSNKMGVTILPPITRKEMNLAQYKKNTFLIDNVENFLRDIGDIHTITVNKENIIDDNEGMIYSMSSTLALLVREYDSYIKKGDFNTALNIMKNIDLLNRQIERVSYTQSNLIQAQAKSNEKETILLDIGKDGCDLIYQSDVFHIKQNNIADICKEIFQRTCTIVNDKTVQHFRIVAQDISGVSQAYADYLKINFDMEVKVENYYFNSRKLDSILPILQ